MPQLRTKSSAALLAENQSDVPNNWAVTITRTGCFMVTVSAIDETVRIASGLAEPSDPARPFGSTIHLDRA
jgi:hypothetical protein